MGMTGGPPMRTLLALCVLVPIVAVKAVFCWLFQRR